MSFKTVILAMALVSAAALPALAEDYANDPAARTAVATVEAAPIFGGKVATPSATVVPSGKSAVTANVALGRTLPQYLADPAYRGGA
jgi:hypothetical protein